MKKLSKAIAITAVAAMSFSCLSVYAADMRGKSGLMSFRPASVRTEMKTYAGPGKGKMHTSMPEKQLNNKNIPGNFGGKMNGRGMKGEMPGKVELTEEEKAAKLEEIKADLAAKLEEIKADLAAKLAAGEITQEKYDEAIAAIENGDFMHGGKAMKGDRHKAPGRNTKTHVAHTLTE